MTTGVNAINVVIVSLLEFHFCNHKFNLQYICSGSVLSLVQFLFSYFILFYFILFYFILFYFIFAMYKNEEK